MTSSTEFELFTQRIFDKLLNNNVLKPINVQHNVKLIGKSGCEHQIDVYWEYEAKGSSHRVAIECKSYNSMIPIGKVRDFFGVLYDLDGVRGIMVSSKGFQTGAKKFAEHYGISLKSLRTPEWNEPIGSITTQTIADVRHCLLENVVFNCEVAEKLLQSYRTKKKIIDCWDILRSDKRTQMTFYASKNGFVFAILKILSGKRRANG